MAPHDKPQGQTWYLRAVEALTCVRRLLKIPAVQVNIATAGGQQVNVVSDLSDNATGQRGLIFVASDIVIAPQSTKCARVQVGSSVRVGPAAARR